MPRNEIFREEELTIPEKRSIKNGPDPNDGCETTEMSLSRKETMSDSDSENQATSIGIMALKEKKAKLLKKLMDHFKGLKSHRFSKTRKHKKNEKEISKLLSQLDHDEHEAHKRTLAQLQKANNENTKLKAMMTKLRLEKSDEAKAAYEAKKKVAKLQLEVKELRHVLTLQPAVIY